MEYRITFGQRYPREPHPTFPQAHKDGYLTVVARDSEDARTQTNDALGPRWAAAYPPGFLDDHWVPLGELGRLENGVLTPTTTTEGAQA